MQKIKVNFCTYKSSPGVAKIFETTQRDNTQTQKVELSLTLQNIQREKVLRKDDQYFVLVCHLELLIELMITHYQK